MADAGREVEPLAMRVLDRGHAAHEARHEPGQQEDEHGDAERHVQHRRVGAHARATLRGQVGGKDEQGGRPVEHDHQHGVAAHRSP